ncbi:substrate-binding periplasmic protein [Halobacteriovorax sp.]|uniref:substrate-binding periplasmic protein n=1 Tax=Halobacteriovorax sp. TaxID=2020862 RepID=UPI0035641637
MRFILASTFLISFQRPLYARSPIDFITENWPPYNYEEDNKIKGYSAEVIRLVMKELKTEAKIKIYPSNRAKQVLDNSKRSMFFSFIKTPQRENKYKWIGPIGKQHIPFYKRKGSTLKIESIEDAKKVHSICCRNSGLVYTALKNLGFNNLDTSKNAINIYSKALMGRCDLAISDTPIGYSYWMDKLKQPHDNLEKTPVNVSDSDIYIVATKDIPDSEIKVWQEALDKVLLSETFFKIKEKYEQ